MMMGALACASGTQAAEAPVLDAVTVTGRAVFGPTLDEPVMTGSRTGLTALELPASVEAVNQRQMRERGDQAVRDAITRTAGLSDIAGPGDGGLSFSARGFTGANSVGIAEDGLRLAVAAGTQTYPMDTWGYERIEVLRGPASVVFGSGTVGAMINAVRKAPQRDRAIETLVAAGDHGSVRAGAGVTGPIDEVTSYRVDVYGLSTDGVRDLGRARGGKLMSALRVAPTARLHLDLMADYSLQQPERYFGAPLVQGQVDPSLRNENYNADDAVIRYEDSRLRGRLSWQVNEAFSLSNEVFLLQANRQWRNIEDYAYVPATAQVERSSYLEILHRQQQRGNRLEARWAGQGHNVVGGWEYTTIGFRHINNFPSGGASTVTLHDVDHGTWASTDATLPKYQTHTSAQAGHIEDAWHVSERWVLLGGFRYDTTRVIRTPLVAPLDAGLDKRLSGTAARAGATYRIDGRTSAYLQYSTGHDPVTTLVTLNLANRDFAFTKGRQVEAGYKQSLQGGRGEWTAAVYRIEKDNIVTQDQLNPALLVQGGRQHSQGVELTGSLAPWAGWRFEGNVALLQARYDELVQNGQSRAGKRPVDVPQQVANLWGHYRRGAWQLSAGVRGVGPRYADTANTLHLSGYAVFDAGLSWTVNRALTLRALARNLGNRTYAIATYNSQALFGDLRRAELVAEASF